MIPEFIFSAIGRQHTILIVNIRAEPKQCRWTFESFKKKKKKSENDIFDKEICTENFIAENETCQCSLLYKRCNSNQSFCTAMFCYLNNTNIFIFMCDKLKLANKGSYGNVLVRLSQVNRSIYLPFVSNSSCAAEHVQLLPYISPVHVSDL